MSFLIQLLPPMRVTVVAAVSLMIAFSGSKAAEKPGVLQAREGATDTVHTDWRKAVHAEFKYTPATPAAPATSPDSVVLAEGSHETPVDDELEVLPKFVVRQAGPDYRELEKVTRVPRQAGAQKVMKKLGIGVYEFKGRHFTFGAATIFFIPVAVGVSW